METILGPLGQSTVIHNQKERIKELEAQLMEYEEILQLLFKTKLHLDEVERYLEEACNELEASGYHHDHLQLKRFREILRRRY